MSRAGHNKRFFESTRGQIVLLLRSGNMTVNEIAKQLSLTDNAVRAHLLSLERDGIVKQAGTVKGFRKPHVSYSLAAEANQLFPKSYDSLFNQLLSVLKGQMVISAVKDLLAEVGKRLGREDPTGKGKNLDERTADAIETLKAAGGSPKLLKEDDRILIISENCPFAEAVAEHPEVCRVAESMVSEIVGHPTREICDRSGLPKCRFEITT